MKCDLILLKEFLCKEMHFRETIKCDSFWVTDNTLNVKLVGSSFFETFKLERYNKWYLKKLKEEREQKLRKIGL